jgi:hypothetical protein
VLSVQPGEDSLPLSAVDLRSQPLSEREEMVRMPQEPGLGPWLIGQSALGCDRAGEGISGVKKAACTESPTCL